MRTARILWSNIYEASYFFGVIETHEGFAFGGYVDSATNHSYFGTMSPLGAMAWDQRAAPQLPYAFGYCAAQLSSGELVTAGYTQEYLTLFKVSKDSVYSWFQMGWESSAEYAVQKLIAASDGGIYVIGNKQIYQGEQQIFVLKISSLGTLEWNTTIHPSEKNAYHIVRAVIPCADGTGDLLISGSNSASFSPKETAELTRVTPAGTIKWQKQYEDRGSFLCGLAVAKVSDGYILAQGYGDITYTLGGQVLLKVDGDGNVVWRRNYRAIYYESTQMITDGDGVTMLSQGTLVHVTADGILSYMAYLTPETHASEAGELIKTSDGAYLLSGGTDGRQIGTPSRAIVRKFMLK